jgi:hypothetical protein
MTTFCKVPGPAERRLLVWIEANPGRCRREAKQAIGDHHLDRTALVLVQKRWIEERPVHSKTRNLALYITELGASALQLEEHK